MNKAAELKSALARQEAAKRLGLKKRAEATLKSEKEEELRLQAQKMVRLRALRLERDAALREAAANKAPGRAKKRK